MMHQQVGQLVQRESSFEGDLYLDGWAAHVQIVPYVQRRDGQPTHFVEGHGQTIGKLWVGTNVDGSARLSGRIEIEGYELGIIIFVDRRHPGQLVAFSRSEDAQIIENFLNAPQLSLFAVHVFEVES